jgi:hypothetical protein
MDRRRPAYFFLQLPQKPLHGPLAGIHKASGQVELPFRGFLAPDQENKPLPGADYAARGGGGVVVINKTTIGTGEFVTSVKKDPPGPAGGAVLPHGERIAPPPAGGKCAAQDEEVLSKLKF